MKSFLATLFFAFSFTLSPASGVGYIKTKYNQVTDEGSLQTSNKISLCHITADNAYWPDQTFAPIDQAWSDPGVLKMFQNGTNKTEAIRDGDTLRIRTFQVGIGVGADDCWALLSDAEQAELRRQLFCLGQVYGTYCK